MIWVRVLGSVYCPVYLQGWLSKVIRVGGILDAEQMMDVGERRRHYIMAK